MTLSHKRHTQFHHLLVTGKTLSPIPYLTLPFSKTNFNYTITEGWMYAKEEKSIHGHRVHGGIDYSLPYGTSVLAPCDGYAMSSYFSFLNLDRDSKPTMYKGKQIYFGLGYFVQIYNPTVKRYIQMAHLSDVSLEIPFSLPVYQKETDTWQPTNHTVLPDEMKTNPNLVQLKRGQVIGHVGFSGVRWGYDEYEEGAKRPLPLDTTKYHSYDEPHVHFDEFGRDENGKKRWQRDPYDIYLRFRNYPTMRRHREIGLEPLFLLNRQSHPFFADSL